MQSKTQYSRIDEEDTVKNKHLQPLTLRRPLRPGCPATRQDANPPAANADRYTPLFELGSGSSIAA